jgi:predicted Zn-dependent protease
VGDLMVDKKDLERRKLDAIARNIKRWQNIPQIIDLCGHKLEIKPKYLSSLYIERDTVLTSIVDGGMIYKNNLKENTGMIVRGMIGAESQGFSTGCAADEQFPRDLKNIYKTIDTCMDYALKYALGVHLQRISHGILIQNGKAFELLSEEDVISIQEPVKEYRTLGRVELHKLSQFSKDMLKHKRITTVNMNVRNYLNKNFFADSEQRKIFSNNYREVLSTIIQFDHESGAKKSYVNVLLNPDYENLDNILNDLFDDITTYVNEESTASAIKSGQYPIILGPSASGTLFHEGLGGHLLSGEYICTGASTTFRDKIGEKIMPLDITIIDDPTDITANGHYTYDEEGVLAQKTVLVENGILRNYLLDRNSAAHFGTKSNGHSRSEWVTEITEDSIYVPVLPEPRTSNMKIYSPIGVDNKKLEQIMKQHCKKEGIEYGLYVDAGAGEVDIETSAFMIYPQAIWKIYTDGRRERVTDGVIVGNAYELIKQISAIGNEPKSTLGICGSNSGGVPVQESAPAIFLPKVTVTAIDQKKYTKRLLEVENYSAE